MKNLIKATFLVLGVVILLAFMADMASATSYTKSYTTVNPTGWSYLRWTHTFTAADDTLYMSLGTTQRPLAPGDTIKGVLNVYTSSLNGDSVDISVRYQQSSDGSNWKSYTVGTDSTTWVTSNTGTNYTLNTFIIGVGTAWGGDMPYKRILIIGNPGNNTVPTGGTKVKVDWIKP